jgi:hypothetical protein
MMRRMEHPTASRQSAPQATRIGPAKTGAAENTPEPLRIKSSKVPGLDLGFPQWLTRRLSERFKRATPKPL